MDATPTFAYGLLLRIVPTHDGGRQSALIGGHEPEQRFKYRPNWGLPGMEPPDQTAAPVLGFDWTNIVPGDTCLAICVALFPQLGWANVQPGADLLMYEGPRICGHARVMWRRSTMWPVPGADVDRFTQWLSESGEYAEPDGPTD